ncbi:hypothetical protein GCAAIG_04150 [Candidatus Electronema halotolerans]
MNTVAVTDHGIAAFQVAENVAAERVRKDRMQTFDLKKFVRSFKLQEAGIGPREVLAKMRCLGRKAGSDGGD